MDVHEDHRDAFLLPQPRDLGVHGVERVFQDGLHERAPLDVDHGDVALGRREDDGPGPRRAGRVVERTQDARLGREVGEKLLLVPDMVAGGDDGHARAQEINGDPGRDAPAGGGVFPVDDDEIHPEFRTDVREVFDDRSPAGLADDVAEEEEFQHVAGNVGKRAVLPRWTARSLAP